MDECHNPSNLCSNCLKCRSISPLICYHDPTHHDLILNLEVQHRWSILQKAALRVVIKLALAQGLKCLETSRRTSSGSLAPVVLSNNGCPHNQGQSHTWVKKLRGTDRGRHHIRSCRHTPPRPRVFLRLFPTQGQFILQDPIINAIAEDLCVSQAQHFENHV